MDEHQRHTRDIGGSEIPKEMFIQQRWLDAVKDGRKRYEARTSSDQQLPPGLKTGDILILKSQLDRITVRVIAIQEFRNIRELLSSGIDVQQIAPGVNAGEVSRWEQQYFKNRPVRLFEIKPVKS